MYQLVDLGPPQGPCYSTAYLQTPKGNFMVKGNHHLLITHIAANDFPPFFGKILIYQHKNNNPNYNLISKGVRLSLRRHNKRLYFFFEGEEGYCFKKTRRMPTKWLDCIETDTKLNLLVSADYLEENGFVVGADFIRRKMEGLPQQPKIYLANDLTQRSRNILAVPSRIQKL